MDCDTAYFEVKVGAKNPTNVLIGVKQFSPKKNINLDTQLSDPADPVSPSWYLKGDSLSLKENDVIGIHWDQTDLPMISFTLNGKILSFGDVNRVKPANDIYPAVSITDAECELIFDDNCFNFPAKSRKFQMIVCATSII